MSVFRPVDRDLTELEGPYECSGCGGHVMLDTTFLEQVSEALKCPYCASDNIVAAKPEEIK